MSHPGIERSWRRAGSQRRDERALRESVTHHSFFEKGSTLNHPAAARQKRADAAYSSSIQFREQAATAVETSRRARREGRRDGERGARQQHRHRSQDEAAATTTDGQAAAIPIQGTAGEAGRQGRETHRAKTRSATARQRRGARRAERGARGIDAASKRGRDGGSRRRQLLACCLCHPSSWHAGSLALLLASAAGLACLRCRTYTLRFPPFLFFPSFLFLPTAMLKEGSAVEQHRANNGVSLSPAANLSRCNNTGKEKRKGQNVSGRICGTLRSDSICLKVSTDLQNTGDICSLKVSRGLRQTRWKSPTNLDSSFTNIHEGAI